MIIKNWIPRDHKSGTLFGSKSPGPPGFRRTEPRLDQTNTGIIHRKNTDMEGKIYCGWDAKQTNKQNKTNKLKMNPGFEIYTWRSMVSLKLFGEHSEVGWKRRTSACLNVRILTLYSEKASWAESDLWPLGSDDNVKGGDVWDDNRKSRLSFTPEASGREVTEVGEPSSDWCSADWYKM